MGQAECSAGMYDMINVDEKAIKANLKIIKDVQTGEDITTTLRDTVFFASRMLLIT